MNVNEIVGFFYPDTEEDPNTEEVIILHESEASGGFGEIYPASRVLANNHYEPYGVVKVFKKQPNRESRDSEWHRLGIVQSQDVFSPYCPKPLETGTAKIDGEEFPAFSMTQIEGVTFEEIRKNLPDNIPTKDLLTLMYGIIEPIAAFHSIEQKDLQGTFTDESMMHGDLKPNNLIVTLNEKQLSSIHSINRSLMYFGQRYYIDNVSIIDFGTTRTAVNIDENHSGITQRLQQNPEILGLQMEYGAPERFVLGEINGKPAAGVDTAHSRSDIWSFGILVLQLFDKQIFASYKDSVDGIFKPSAEGCERLCRDLPKIASSAVESLQGYSSLKTNEEIAKSAIAGIISLCLKPKPDDRPSAFDIMEIIEKLIVNYDELIREIDYKDSCLLKVLPQKKLNAARVKKTTPLTPNTPLLNTRKQNPKAEKRKVEKVTPSLFSYPSPGKCSTNEKKSELPLVERQSITMKILRLLSDCLLTPIMLTTDKKFRASFARRHPFALSFLCTIPPFFAVPLLWWSRLSIDNCTHLDAACIIAGILLLVISAIAVSLEKRKGIFRAILAISLASIICYLAPPVAIIIPSSIHASNANYIRGLECEQNNDISKAIVYFEDSASNGNPFAAFTLGQYYEYGTDDLEPNADISQQYYKQAEESGYCPAD